MGSGGGGIEGVGPELERVARAICDELMGVGSSGLPSGAAREGLLWHRYLGAARAAVGALGVVSDGTLLASWALTGPSDNGNLAYAAREHWVALLDAILAPVGGEASKSVGVSAADDAATTEFGRAVSVVERLRGVADAGALVTGVISALTVLRGPTIEAARVSIQGNDRWTVDPSFMVKVWYHILSAVLAGGGEPEVVRGGRSAVLGQSLAEIQARCLSEGPEPLPKFEARFCKDCQFHKRIGPASYGCFHGASLKHRHPVDGLPVLTPVFCSDARGAGWPCGPSGLLWEAKR